MGMRQPRSPTVIPFSSGEQLHYSCRSKDEQAGSILPPQPAAPAGTAAPGTLLSPGSSSMPTCTETSASGLALSTAPGAAGRYGQPVPARREQIQEEQGYARRQQESLAQAPEQAEGTRGGSKLCSAALAVPAGHGRTHGASVPSTPRSGMLHRPSPPLPPAKASTVHRVWPVGCSQWPTLHVIPQGDFSLAHATPGLCMSLPRLQFLS